MSVKNEHPEYTAMLPKWKRCRDVAAGQDAVHAAGESYLPKLKDQSKDDYEAYKMRATFYNATWRTIAGMLGMLFRKPPTVEVPEDVEEMLNDVTMSGMPLQIFAQKASQEAVEVGRIGLLVDFPVASPNATKADAKVLNLRPSMSMYKAESIINWRYRHVNNRYVLSQVVLKEIVMEAEDEFTEKPKLQYRVLDLAPETDTYRVRLFEVIKGTDGIERDVQIGNDAYPMKAGKNLDYIPLWILGVDDIAAECDVPPIIDLVDMNLSHYRSNADYEHGCHFTGLPTAVVCGYTPMVNDAGQPTEKLYIGSQAAWMFPDPNAHAEFLEFTGQGLTSLKDNLDRKEAQMAILGARMLEVQKKAAEAAETAGIHRAGENSVLSSTAQTLSLGLTLALKTFCEWAGATSVDDVKFVMNRDFFPMPMDPNKLNALTNAYLKGTISFETYFNQLQQGEIIASARTLDEEQSALPPVPKAPDDKAVV